MLIREPPVGFLAALAEAATTVGGEPIAGCGSAAGNASALRRSLAEAQMALRIARTQPADDRVVQGTRIGSHAQLLQLLEPATVAAYRDAVLRPLQDWDREHSSELLNTLRSFLESAGQWRETARKLHIHPNSLRYRLGRVEQLTGRSLSSTADRVDLFLALAALRTTGLVRSSRRSPPSSCACPLARHARTQDAETSHGACPRHAPSRRFHQGHERSQWLQAQSRTRLGRSSTSGSR